MLAQAYRIAVQARAPYVGTEHLVVAAFWADYARPLRLQGITYTQAAQQLTTLPRTEQTVDDGAIEPLTAVAVPTPAAANLADTAPAGRAAPGPGRPTGQHAAPPPRPVQAHRSRHAAG
jgi:hypothetical protein